MPNSINGSKSVHQEILYAERERSSFETKKTFPFIK
jgi:hypothetical protein